MGSRVTFVVPELPDGLNAIAPAGRHFGTVQSYSHCKCFDDGYHSVWRVATRCGLELHVMEGDWDLALDEPPPPPPRKRTKPPPMDPLF